MDDAQRQKPPKTLDVATFPIAVRGFAVHPVDSKTRYGTARVVHLGPAGITLLFEGADPDPRGCAVRLALDLPAELLRELGALAGGVR